MAARPIAEVRGDNVMRPSPRSTFAAPPILPDMVGLPVEKLAFEPRADGPRWVVSIKGVPGRASPIPRAVPGFRP